MGDFVSGVSTLFVLFLLFCGVVIVIEYVPVLGVALAVVFGMLVVSSLIGFIHRGR